MYNFQKNPKDQLFGPILTTRQVANMLGVAVSTAQLWMESGAIPAWKTPGGHRRCHLSAIRQIIEQRALPAIKLPLDSAASPAAEFLLAKDPAYPTSTRESERLAALDSSDLIDSKPDRRFDRITWLATQITGCPMALVSLLTSERQWFKSSVGFDVTETPRDWAFCNHTILSEDIFIVEDAWLDDRFRDNPLVTGAPFIRFYAGFAVHDAEQNRLGTLCVLAAHPHSLNTDQVRGLRELAHIVSDEISRRN